MYLPQLNELDRDRELIEVFKGYNHNLRIGEGEFYNMRNLSSNNYPVISPRALRGVFKKDVAVQGIIAKDGICYINNGEFYYHKNGEKYPLFTIGLGISDIADINKTIMVSMGAYIIIFAKTIEGDLIDAYYINTSKSGTNGLEHGKLSTEKYVTNVKMMLCDKDGALIGTVDKNDANVQDGDVWIDTSSEPFVAYKYSKTSMQWVQYDTYIRLNISGVDKDFDIGDGVKIEYLDIENLPDGFKNVPSGLYTIENKGKDYIVIPGVIKSVIEKNATEAFMRLSTPLPKMDYVIESGNRLWGCYYGNDKGEMVNEIYASKLGDFKNWYSYQGISTDSYAVSVGSDGEFTGAITYKGQPIFFKENCMHRVYGTMPSNYQMQTTECRGVMKGADKSLAIVNELLYYKSRSSICMYDGSYPTEVSQPLGESLYGEAVGGALGSKYYISLKSLERSTDVNSVYELFVLDTAKGLWHKEDDTYMSECTSYMGNLYYIDGKDSTKIKTILKGSYEGEKEVGWMAETGIIGLSNPDRRYISKINIRASTTVNSWFSVFIKYNSMGDWIYVGRVIGANLQSHNLPIIPKRCDHFQLKFEGVGEVKIYSICKTIEQGGEY